jgi:hypothetical protein
VACLAVDDAAKPYLTRCHDEEDFVALKLCRRKRWGAWSAVVPRPVEADMIGCGVAYLLPVTAVGARKIHGSLDRIMNQVLQVPR